MIVISTGRGRGGGGRGSGGGGGEGRRYVLNDFPLLFPTGRFFNSCHQSFLLFFTFDFFHLQFTLIAVLFFVANQNPI